MRYLIILLLLIPLFSNAQTDSAARPVVTWEEVEKFLMELELAKQTGNELKIYRADSRYKVARRHYEEDMDSAFLVVEQMPKFRRGEKALITYLANTPYPREARLKGIEGVVYVQFVIDKKGNVTNAKVIRGADVTLDRAALRRVEKMPRWKPGKQSGKPVRVIFRVRINFKLT